jgi:hypothetical protein
MADFKYNAHMYFGKRYKFDEVKVDWRIPGDEGKLRERPIHRQILICVDISEIDMVFRAIGEVFQPVADKVEALLDNPATDTAEWVNDMCRYLFILKSSLSGLAPGFWLEDQERKPGGKQVELW